LLRRTFGVEPRRTVDPDEAVALGAAVLCGMMDGDAALENFEVARARAREWCAERLSLYLSLSFSLFRFIMHLLCGASRFFK
jgi:molecular chaperone DnaK (HSP70)